jgi:hypothetical protein
LPLSPTPPDTDMLTATLECTITSIGEPAFALLPPQGRIGTVIASFSRSCWLETTGERLFAVADHRLGEGPLTIGAALPDGLTLSELGIKQGINLVADGSDFQLGSRLILRTAATALWRPAPLGPRASNGDVARRLRALIDSVAADAPVEGLAPLIGYLGQLACGDEPGPADVGLVPRLAMPSVALLAKGVVRGDGGAVDQAVQGLIGLGPGLTPSGDDMLGGLMVALRTVLLPVSYGEKPLQECPESSSVLIIDELSRSIFRHSARTNRISAALLEQAALGIGSAAQHQVLECLLELTPAIDLDNSIERLVNSGHTSGWDALTGLLFGVALALRLTNSGVPYAESIKAAIDSRQKAGAGI